MYTPRMYGKKTMVHLVDKGSSDFIIERVLAGIFYKNMHTEGRSNQ